MSLKSGDGMDVEHQARDWLWAGGKHRWVQMQVNFGGGQVEEILT